jgi:hypothetical protein
MVVIGHRPAGNGYKQMTRSGAQHTQKLRAMDAAALNLLPHHVFTLRGVRVSRDQETRQRKNQDGVKKA